MFGINGAEVLVLLLVALVVVGPERLPAYAEQLGAWTRRLRELVGTAKQRVSAELGEDSDVDWASLDPRRYDPRRIVREALLEEVTAPPVTGRSYTTRSAAAATGAAGAGTAAAAAAASGDARGAGVGAPFDDEAT
ncbi:Sec-independent protein translocase TatB [Cellulomonas sp. APG4]|uniref:twin-arginine translocase TatA/TatE family subunit n=1 Tax=Cellulomonas sp. APG4 TaxID=1538656 RepID=UPI00137ACB79|nr:Sec-independent protein translocase TatB [Cellulomonas sp. APG4]